MNLPRFILSGADPLAAAEGVKAELDGEIVEDCLEACLGDPGWVLRMVASKVREHPELNPETSRYCQEKLTGKVRLLVEGKAVWSKEELMREVFRILDREAGL